MCILRFNQVWQREYRCTYALLWSALPLVCICLFFNYVSAPGLMPFADCLLSVALVDWRSLRCSPVLWSCQRQAARVRPHDVRYGRPCAPPGGGGGLKHAERQPRAAAPGAFTSCLQTRGLFAGPGGERHGMRRSDQPLVVSRCRIGILVAFFGGERGSWAYGWGSGQICGGGPDDSCWGW